MKMWNASRTRRKRVLAKGLVFPGQLKDTLFRNSDWEDSIHELQLFACDRP